MWYVQRVETSMFPEDGCRELVLNAVQHKNYLRPVSIQISVYPDRIYIYNIGEMPPEITPAERLFKKHPSVPRNPNIANTFFRAGMVEGWGRGYEKVVEVCEAAGANLPVVEADFGGLMVRIDESAKYRDLRLGLTDLPHSHATDATEDATEAVLLSLIADNPAMKQMEMVEKTGRHRATIARKLKALKDSGRIERIGSDRDGSWKILKP
ncbi:MAG: MarR family transcriptional regulator [Coriobacteriaceae bacterium]|jgi:ATP-dependent DNA helicase RecG|nr:MarR family transcriptional regulator [Coriobacteriaceae bacterium]